MKKNKVLGAKTLASLFCASLISAGCSGTETTGTGFGPASNLSATEWDVVNIITGTTCVATEQVGDEQTEKTIAFTQDGDSLTATFIIPELAQTAALGGSTEVAMTGTRDGADFEMTGTATVVDQSGCLITSAETFSGTIGDDGILTGVISGTTETDTSDICNAVLTAAVGADLATVLITSCTSISDYDATEQE